MIATSTTVQAWLTDANVDIKTVSYFGLVGLPYTVKFLWAPFLDALIPPFLGLRRGWMVLAQIGLFISTIVMACMDPATQMPLFALATFFVALFSATQDIVVDAYRIELIKKDEEIGAAASTYVSAYRIAMWVAGGPVLIMADGHFAWREIYIGLAVLNLIGMATILLSPEPLIARSKKKISFKEMVTDPFIEFFRRNGAMEILLFIMVYKLSTLMATALSTKFLMTELHYSKTVIGATNKLFGIIFTILGTLGGGSLMAGLGLKRSLWIFGIVQSLVGLTYCLLARLAHGDAAEIWLVIMVSVDNFMMGMGTAALTGFMMKFCNRQFTGTQYALLTSVMAVGRVVLVTQAGVWVEHMGWDLFYLSTVALAVPGLLLLFQFEHWETQAAKVHDRMPTVIKASIFVFMLSLLLLVSPVFVRWLMDDEQLAHSLEIAGALGIVLVVMVGVVRPHLETSRRKLRRARA